MSKRAIQLLIVFFLLLFIGAGIYLWSTSNEELGNIDTMSPTEEEPVEVRDDEVDLPSYGPDARDTLETTEPE